MNGRCNRKEKNKRQEKAKQIAAAAAAEEEKGKIIEEYFNKTFRLGNEQLDRDLKETFMLIAEMDGLSKIQELVKSELLEKFPLGRNALLELILAHEFKGVFKNTRMLVTLEAVKRRLDLKQIERVMRLIKEKNLSYGEVKANFDELVNEVQKNNLKDKQDASSPLATAASPLDSRRVQIERYVISDLRPAEEGPPSSPVEENVSAKMKSISSDFYLKIVLAIWTDQDTRERYERIINQPDSSLDDKGQRLKSIIKDLIAKKKLSYFQGLHHTQIKDVPFCPETFEIVEAHFNRNGLDKYIPKFRIKRDTPWLLIGAGASIGIVGVIILKKSLKPKPKTRQQRRLMQRQKGEK